MKRAVTCTRCLQTRYVKPPVPDKYVCRRCQHGAGKKDMRKVSDPRPKVSPRSPDPWYSDMGRRQAVNARGTPGGWIPDRPDWLRPRGLSNF